MGSPNLLREFHNDLSNFDKNHNLYESPGTAV